MGYTPEKIRNILLAGHSSSGKTSLAEALLFLTKSSDRFGSVAAGTTVMDFEDEEIRRKASVSLATAPLEYNGTKVNLLDAPGLFDFELGQYEGVQAADAVQAIADSYAQGVTDEFVLPTVCCPDAQINEGDSVIFMNFRPDRAREMTWALTLPEFDGFERKKTVFPVNFVCTAQYDEKLTCPIAYPPEVLECTLGEYIAGKDLKQLRIAETEKYAHVTFFFNGGVETVYPGEDRILIDSPKQFPTYDMIPEMSAVPVAEALVEQIETEKYDMIICNFANCDMVGHTGDMNAAIKAVETVDACVGQVVDACTKHGYIVCITADHGNADLMFDENGKVNTAHTTNPVPFLVKNATAILKPGRLCDIAPTMLDLMGLEIPSEMTGESLLLPIVE